VGGEHSHHSAIPAPELCSRARHVNLAEARIVPWDIHANLLDDMAKCLGKGRGYLPGTGVPFTREKISVKE